MLCRLMDRRANALVRSATAYVARHSRVDILIAGILIVFEKSNRLHDLAGLAVAALWNPNLHPRLLHRMHGRDAFNRRNLGAADSAHRRSARATCRAILMHRTRAAQRHAAAK